MTRVEEYRLKAQEAERMAARAVTPEERGAYEKIAQGWRELERAAARPDR